MVGAVGRRLGSPSNTTGTSGVTAKEQDGCGGWGTGYSQEEASRSGHSHWTLNREAQVITQGGGAEESDKISSLGDFC